MGRYKKDVKYWLKNGYWYYKTEDMTGYKSTGEKNKTKAEAVVAKLRLRKIAGKKNQLFKDYAEPFFDWERCPHVLRLKAEGKHIGERYCHSERVLLEQYVFSSSLGKKL